MAIKKDLENTPFITNTEIISYSILNDTVKQADATYVSQSHVFEVLNAATKKINSLIAPLVGAGNLLLSQMTQ